MTNIFISSNVGTVPTPFPKQPVAGVFLGSESGNKPMNIVTSKRLLLLVEIWKTNTGSGAQLYNEYGCGKPEELSWI